MKSVILALGAVVVLGCVEQPSSRPVSKAPRATVFDELAAAVKGAVAAKRVEDNRLAQYGVEKQRLVSRLIPNGDWADGHPLAIEGYVSERDPESAKNLSVVLDLEFMAAEAIQSDTPRSRELQLVLEERVPVRPTSEPDRRGFKGLFPSKGSTATRPVPQNPSGHPHSPCPTMIAP